MKKKKLRPSHFETCIDENCERKWCVDRRNAKCAKEGHNLTENGTRCTDCHEQLYCSGYGWCEIHGEHGP